MSAMAVNDISRWTKSIHKCPACERALWTLMLPEGRIWYCGWGPCPSLTTNDGASSVEELNRRWEAEPEQVEKEEDWP